MHTLIDRLKVILTATVTALTLAAVIITQAATLIAAELDERWAELVVQYGASAVAWISAAILIIRRVTPVDTDLRGVLPAPGSTPIEGVDYRQD